MQPVADRQPIADRLHALDAVRAFALLAGVAMHVVPPWLENLPDWNFGDTPSATAAAIWFFGHIFRMPVFFLIAGYFGRLLAERHGTTMFIKDRAKRIALPMVIGFAAITPLVALAFALGSLASGMSLADLTALVQAQREHLSTEAGGAGGLGGVTLGHLWFLYYLLLFYVVALISRATARAVDRDGKALCGIDRMLRFFMRTGLAALAFALPVAAWYVFEWPEWAEWQGLPTPQSIVPSVPALLAYGLSFAVGWLLHRQTHLLLQLRERWVEYSLAAAVLAVGCYLIAGPTPQWSPHLGGWELHIYAVAYLMATWCSIFALIGLALRFLSNASPVRRYVSDSSYWLYLWHPVPIAFFMMWLRPLGWHWSVRFAITLAASVLLLLLSYHAFVRFTFIGATLNGRRHRRPVAAEDARTSEPSGIGRRVSGERYRRFIHGHTITAQHRFAHTRRRDREPRDGPIYPNAPGVPTPRRRGKWLSVRLLTTGDEAGTAR
jgi:glucan biosynthesis protein C